MCRFGFLTLAASKHHKFNITTALEDTVYENCGGKGTGMMGGPTVVSMQCAASQGNVVWQSNYALKAMNGAGNDIIACKTSKNQHCDSSGGQLYENHGGQVTGAGGGQTVVSMRCTANQRNIVCQSNYVLRAINGAGNDIIA